MDSVTWPLGRWCSFPPQLLTLSHLANVQPAGRFLSPWSWHQPFILLVATNWPFKMQIFPCYSLLKVLSDFSSATERAKSKVRVVYEAVLRELTPAAWLPSPCSWNTNCLQCPTLPVCPLPELPFPKLLSWSRCQDKHITVLLGFRNSGRVLYVLLQ